MSDKTATDKLRELLESRGVHYVGDGDTVRWIGRDGCVCRAYTRAYSRRADLCLDVAITYVPPERAIEATLGNGEVDKLRSENAKLRELVRGLNYCSDELTSAECDKCPLYDPADPVLEPKCVRMMRELGIEVGE